MNKLYEYLETLETIDSFGLTKIPNLNEIKYALEKNGLEIESFLKQFEMFSNVKKINILEMPTYYSDIKTGEPLSFKKDYLGEDCKFSEVVSFNHTSQSKDFNFNDEIDLYMIYLSPKKYDIKNLDCGVWVFPSMYSPTNFKPLKKIEIIWSPEKVQDVSGLNDLQANEVLKETILNKLSEILNSDKPLEPNIPYTRDIIIRCSPRSVKTLVDLVIKYD